MAHHAIIASRCRRPHLLQQIHIQSLHVLGQPSDRKSLENQLLRPFSVLG